MTLPDVPRSLVLIAGLGLALRLGVVLATPDFQPLFDAREYHRHALSISSWDGYPQAPQGGPTAYRAPLFPYMLGLLYAIGGGWMAGRLTCVLLGVATVLLVFVLAQLLWGRRIGLIAAFVAAAFPPLVALSASLLSESLFIPLILAATIGVLLSRRAGGDIRWAAASGILCGLAALTRSNGLILVIPLALGAWLAFPRLNGRALAAPGALVLATIVVLAPWTVRNAIVFDSFVPVTTQAGYGLAGTYNEEVRGDERVPGRWRPPHKLSPFDDLFARGDLDEAELGRALARRGLEYALDHPGYVLRVLTLNALRTFDLLPSDTSDREFHGLVLQGAGLSVIPREVVVLSTYLVGALAVGGVAALAARRARERGPLFVWLLPLFLVGSAVGISGLTRYRSPAEPFLILLCALAAERLWHLSRQGRRPTRLD